MSGVRIPLSLYYMTKLLMLMIKVLLIRALMLLCISSFNHLMLTAVALRISCIVYIIFLFLYGFFNQHIYSVLFLVLSFVSSASLLFFLECEYISLIFIIIYVGAIAVLFLFVVMMLDVKTINMSKDFLKYFPFGSFIGTIFLVKILLSVSSLFEAFNPYNVSFLSNFYVD